MNADLVCIQYLKIYMPETHWPERRNVNMSTLLVQVYINYVGKLQDGKTVHSNGEEKPYKFKLGKF